MLGLDAIPCFRRRTRSRDRTPWSLHDPADGVEASKRGFAPLSLSLPFLFVLVAATVSPGLFARRIDENICLCARHVAFLRAFRSRPASSYHLVCGIGTATLDGDAWHCGDRQASCDVRASMSFVSLGIWIVCARSHGDVGLASSAKCLFALRRCRLSPGLFSSIPLRLVPLVLVRFVVDPMAFYRRVSCCHGSPLEGRH